MILITDATKARRESVAEMFYYMGILAIPSSPEEALRTLTPRFSAMLFTGTEEIDNPEGLADTARAIGLTTVAAITDEPSNHYDVLLRPGTYSAAIASAINEHRRSRGLHPLGRYECMGFDASADRSAPTYLGRPLPLTRTETMILRYLIRAYPDPVTPDEVLKHAFRSSRTPEPSSVRTHVSIINKKLRSAIGRRLTDAEAEGYVICAPNAPSLTYGCAK